MQRLISYPVIFAAGISIGWLLHGSLDSTPPPIESMPTTVMSPAPVTSSRRSVSTQIVAEKEVTQPLSRSEFLQLLNTQFGSAIEVYAFTQRQNPEAAALLRPALDSWLRQCMSHCASGEFSANVNAWLHLYYEDIPVLLLLAEHQTAQGFPEEAARTLQYASTYAYEKSQLSAVAAALESLVVTTDQRMAASTNWVELAGFYELLDSIGLTQPQYQLRQALLYQQLGEFSSARALLLNLAAADENGDEEWREGVQAALRNSSDTTPQEMATMTAPQTIPLQRLGEHYVLQASIDNIQLSLLIDTGASITTLSRTGFNKLDSAGLQYLGKRLFNTAGGVASGEVYQTNAITLGDSTWQQLDIAVLDYPTAAGVDGLLGMNLLRNYRFQIDQDQLLLYLQPR
ncbi:hypothetical protein EYC98_16840 [Halieaceae bacterium IMCC14734]|uniref:Peptidase A2 domain-containing protein n=1 Tax=Candidatus Litorirhabdus singularis TaxID=2518993 RepID=A0ABT3TLB3_9GAMM|nr:retropepsin-like aspartic protease [Candidatus Litorirhabdus singularis]MCX2982531.1 hypothetical protein [Candidatus Litorirhabdus singularis]